MAEVDETLKERGSRYGTIEENYLIVHEFKEVVKNSPAFKRGDLSIIHLESLNMIFCKISRMLSGDPNYPDNAHDIAGYAKLLEDHLLRQKNGQS